MKTIRSLLCAISIASFVSACGGSSSGNAGAADTGASPSAPVPSEPTAEPFAECVDPALQAAGGATLKTSSGLNLDTVILGDGTTGLVFAAQLGGNLCQWLPTAQLMAKQGYRTAVFNYSGAAGGEDVLAAVDELKRRGATSVALVGASKGGTAVLSAASGTDVKAVVALSAPTIFEATNAIEGMAEVTAPTWIGVGEFDYEFTADSRNLYKASGAKVKHLEVVQSTDHGVDLLPDLRDKITAFLAKYAPAQAS